MRETTEAIVGAVTGPPTAVRSLLLGRYDTAGRLQYTGRTTTLPQAAGRAIAALLAPADSGHPWAGWSFSAGWGTRDTLDVMLVRDWSWKSASTSRATLPDGGVIPYACTAPAQTLYPPTSATALPLPRAPPDRSSVPVALK